MTPEQRAAELVAQQDAIIANFITGNPGYLEYHGIGDDLRAATAAAISEAVAEEREAIAADLDQQASNLAALFETQWESECDAERVDERRTIAAAIRDRVNRCPPA